MDRYKKKNEKSNLTPDYAKYIKKDNAIQFVKGMEVDELPMKIIVTSIMRRPRGRQNDSVNKLSVEKQRVEWGSTYYRNGRKDVIFTVNNPNDSKNLKKN